MKTCTQCKEDKPLSEYYADKRLSDGKRTNCKTCHNAKRVDRYYANREEELARASRYQAANRDKYNERERKYRAENPEYEINKSAKRRSLKGGAKLPTGYWKAMLTFYGAQCAKCGSGDRLTFDHVQPLSLGGEHSLRNGQILCYSCNSAKRNHNSDDYRGADILVDVINGLGVAETRLNNNKEVGV